MIIFDYATLADDSPRRHFILPPFDFEWGKNEKGQMLYGRDYEGNFCDGLGNTWKPNETDYAAYYAAAKDDKPIKCVDKLLEHLKTETSENLRMPFEIWADFPSFMEDELTAWFYKHSHVYSWDRIRLRPDGDTTPWHELKEKWITDIIGKAFMEKKHSIEMTFEPSGSPAIEMWKRYSVPVFELHL